MAGVARYRFGSGGNRLSWSVNGSTGIATSEGAIALGGKDRHSAAVLVRVRGTGGGGRFQVLLNGQPRFVMRAGRVRTIFLRPYKQYRVAIRPTKDTTADVDVSERKITLYPGNTKLLEWRVKLVTVVFGKLTDPSGKPLANQKLRGVVGIAETDDAGAFQAEVQGRNAIIKAQMPNGKDCAVTLRKLTAKNGYANVGNLICR